jgi:hypothetical protein
MLFQIKNYILNYYQFMDKLYLKFFAFIDPYEFDDYEDFYIKN